MFCISIYNDSLNVHSCDRADSDRADDSLIANWPSLSKKSWTWAWLAWSMLTQMFVLLQDKPKNSARSWCKTGKEYKEKKNNRFWIDEVLGVQVVDAHIQAQGCFGFLEIGDDTTTMREGQLQSLTVYSPCPVCFETYSLKWKKNEHSFQLPYRWKW